MIVMEIPLLNGDQYEIFFITPEILMKIKSWVAIGRQIQQNFFSLSMILLLIIFQQIVKFSY